VTNQQRIIKTKVGILELAKQLGNVSQACKVMGYSRDSLYWFKTLYDARRRSRASGNLKAETEQKEPSRPSSRKGSSGFRMPAAGLWTTACEQRTEETGHLCFPRRGEKHLAEA